MRTRCDHNVFFYHFFASLNDDFERLVRFEVTVEEEFFAGRSQNVSANVLFHKYKYKMDFIKTSEYFKPGLKYSAFVSGRRDWTGICVY